MRVLLLIAIALSVSAAIGAPTALRIVLSGPAGTRTLATLPITCSQGGSFGLNATFGTYADCEQLCAQGSKNDGAYALRVSVSPALTCIGPDGTRAIPGTGGRARVVPVSFCADPSCAVRTPYCDCVPPSNLTIASNEQYLSRPINATVSFTDNHDPANVTITTPAGVRTVACSGDPCTASVRIPVGSGCNTTGAGTCVVRAVARDRWSNERVALVSYSIDLQAPNVSLSWANGTGSSWFANSAVVLARASDGLDQSGVAAIYIARNTTGTGCPPPGDDYERYPVDASADPVRVIINASSDGSVSVCAYAEDRAIPVPNRSPPLAARLNGRIDVTPPRLSISPSPSRWYALNRTFNVTCNDGSGSGCVGRALLTTSGACPSFEAVDLHASPTSQTSTCPAGVVCHEVLCAYGLDAVGHETVTNATVGIDRSAPTITITNRTLSAGELSVTALVNDAGSGLSGCTLTINDSRSSSNTSCSIHGSATGTASLTANCSGTCTLTVDALDRAGNEAHALETVEASGNV